MKKLLALLGLVTISLVSNPVVSFAQAQSKSTAYFVRGKLVSQVDSQAVNGAHVFLALLQDSTIKSTITNQRGFFAFRSIERPQNARLVVTFVGYEEVKVDLEITEASTIIPDIYMKPSVLVLEGVEIEDVAERVKMQGDTMVFRAESYKANPDANAEDLLAKMPGFIVDNGQVKAQGEDVKRVLVDGRRFFGDDPTVALRNLPAEIIQKIEVFDQQSEQSQFTGFDDGESVKTLNIVTKENMRNGEFGKVFAGVGTDRTYQAGGAYNVFDGDRRISIIGHTNNVNDQNFSNEDLLGVMGTGGQRGPGGGGFSGGGPGGAGGGMAGMRGGGASDFMVGQQNGISKTHSIGLNYNDFWGEKIEINASYFFNMSENNASELVNLEYFLPIQDVLYYRETNNSDKLNMNQRFNMRFNYNINDKNSLMIMPRISWQSNDANTAMYGFNETTGAEIIGQTFSNRDNKLIGYNYSNMLMWRHKFDKAGRTISLNVNHSINAQEGDQYMISGMPSRGTSGQIDTTRQFTDIYNNTTMLGGNLNYTETISNKGMLMVGYGATYQQGDIRRETYLWNEHMQDYTDLDTLLSNVYNNDYITHRANLSYRYRAGMNMFLMTTLSYQVADMYGQETYPHNFDIDKMYQNILPMVMLNARMKNSRNLRIMYRTRTSVPSISQLQGVIDNSNPLKLTTGNPDLDQDYGHTLFARYGTANQDKGRSFFLYVGGTITNNYIGKYTFITPVDTVFEGGIRLQPGGEISRPVNLEGHYNMRAFLTYGLPVEFIKSNLNFNLSATYQQIPGKLNDQVNHSNSTTFGGGVVISSNVSEKLDFTLSVSPNVNNIENTAEKNANQDYMQVSSRFKINWIFLNNWFLNSTINHTFYSGLPSSYDPNFMIWNMSFGKKILKDQRGDIRLTVYDLLNENQSFSRTVNDIYVEDVKTNVLQQYFMLTFTYKIRNFGAPAATPQQDFRRNGMGMPPFGGF